MLSVLLKIENNAETMHLGLNIFVQQLQRFFSLNFIGVKQASTEYKWNTNEIQMKYKLNTNKKFSFRLFEENYIFFKNTSFLDFKSKFSNRSDQIKGVLNILSINV